MKMQFQILVASSLLLAAGCANNERYATYDDSISPAGTGYAAGGGASATTESYAQPASSSSYSYQENAPATVGSQERSQPAPAEGATADATLTAQVQAALYNDSTLASVAPRIQVAARDGRVTLKGTVSSEQQRRDIETRVQATSGVVAVNNQLQISPEPTGRGESSHIYSNATSRASSAVGAAEPPGGRLYSNGSSANADLSATSSGGAARQYESGQSPTPQTSGALNPEERKDVPPGADANASSSASSAEASPTTGSVENQNASGAASSPGASQAGAATSENTSANQGDQQNLRSSSLQGYSSSGSRETGKDGFSVKVQGTSESDRAIGQQITQSLRADPEVASSLPTVRISIENGKAILQGSVKSDAQRRKLETLVQQTTGVSSVENQLRVSGAGGGTTNP